jgi:hypothetical protein
MRAETDVICSVQFHNLGWLLLVVELFVAVSSRMPLYETYLVGTKTIKNPGPRIAKTRDSKSDCLFGHDECSDAVTVVFTAAHSAQ